MPRPLLSYRIFIASPGGLDSERKLFRKVVEQYNTSDALENVEGLAWATGNLAIAKKNLGETSIARNLFETAIGFERSLGTAGVALLGKDLSCLAGLELGQSNLDLAEKLLKEAIGINQSNGFRKYLRQNYSKLSNLYFQRGALKEGNNYLDLAQHLYRIRDAEDAAIPASRKRKAAAGPAKHKPRKRAARPPKRT